MQLVVDNLLTTYEKNGTGKLIVLLHGWGDNSKGLAGLQKELAKKYQVIALDLPGFGNSQAPPIAWDLDNYAAFLNAFLEKLKLGKPYAIVGHSNGGALTIRAVSTGKVTPEKIVLLAPSGIRNSQPLKRVILKVIAKIGNIATIWMPERYRRTLRESLYGAVGSDMMVAPQLEETFKRTVRQDVQADAAKITQPTLLVFGKDDRAVPLVDGERYHQLIKSSRLEIIEAGHFVHLDQATQVVQLISDFL